MIKLLLSLVVVMFAGIATADAKCESRALNEVFKIYKNECGGVGTFRDSCELLNSTQVDGQLKLTAMCSFSGEPDYSDYAEVEFTFAPRGCKVANQDVKECYTN